MKPFKILKLVLLFFFTVSIDISIAQEILFFDMYKTVTKDDAGFPKGNFASESNNCNWVSPVDYTTGTIYIRVEARTAPTHVCIRPSFAIWQLGEAVVPYSARPHVDITPDPEDISVGYGNFNFADWKYIGDTTKWDSCRIKMAPVIKSCDDKFISPSNDWDWGGKNPDDWYPMKLRFSMVIVAEGNEFSGWETYIGTVTGIEVEEEELIIDPQEITTIEAEVYPSDAVMKGYIVESLNPDIVEVKDEIEGRIWSIQPGEVTITVTSIDGNYTDTCTVTVRGEVASSTQDKATTTQFIVKNPAPSNNIQFNFQSVNSIDKSVHIFDLSGKCVWSQSKIKEKFVTLNLSGKLNKGIYIVNMKDEKNIYTNKLIIKE